MWAVYRAVHFLTSSDTRIIGPALYERAPLHQPADVKKHVILGSEDTSGRLNRLAGARQGRATARGSYPSLCSRESINHVANKKAEASPPSGVDNHRPSTTGGARSGKTTVFQPV